MARVYAGELNQIDEEILDVAKRFPDDFWVFTEFNIGRNIDWFIIRPKPFDPATLILTELKRLSRPVRGMVDGIWERQLENGEWEEIPPSNSDMNYYWQSVNTANYLADWLWTNQQIYRERSDIRPADEFRVWPDLLLLSPPGIQHRLPLGPPSRYGRWFYSIESWMHHVTSWNSKMGILLSQRDVANLAEALQLEPIYIPANLEREPLRGDASRPGSELDAFMQYIQRLEQRIARLEQRLGPDRH